MPRACLSSVHARAFNAFNNRRPPPLHVQHAQFFQEFVAAATYIMHKHRKVAAFNAHMPHHAHKHHAVVARRLCRRATRGTSLDITRKLFQSLQTFLLAGLEIVWLYQSPPVNYCCCRLSTAIPYNYCLLYFCTLSVVVQLYLEN